MLAARGARVNGTNMGDDTPLHIAASKGHREVVLMVSFVYDIMQDLCPILYIKHKTRD